MPREDASQQARRRSGLARIAWSVLYSGKAFDTHRLEAETI